MRILALTNLYPRPGHPTLATYNRQQFEALAAAGHDLAVVAPVAWTDEARDLRAGRRTPRRYRTPGGIEVRHPRYYFPPGILRAAYGGFFLRSVRGAVERQVRESRPEVVLACWAHPDGWAAVRLARAAGLPVAIKVVGSDVLVATRSPRRRARVVEALRAADAVVAVSRDLADAVVGLGVPADRVEVVYNGVDRDLFRPGDRDEARRRLGLGLGPGDRVVLFVGNLLLSKGAGVLIEAMGLLRRRPLAGPTRCLLVGRGRDEARLRDQVARLGLADVVALVGPRPLDQLPDWYRAADVVALPSFSEGIPNVLLEAAAAGRPFVAAAVGGIPEIPRGGGSRLVPPGDPAAVAEALGDVLDGTGRDVPTPPPGPDDAACLPSWAASARRLVGVLAAARAGRSAEATTNHE